ncbi:hypothetical protein AAE478_001238 [Parahypoxylon ruwenzoriense]
MPHQRLDTQIVRAAVARRVPYNSRLKTVPAKLKLNVVSNIDDISSIVNLAVTGPTFYGFITANQEFIARRSISVTVDPELLPLAVAHYHATAARWKVKRDENGLAAEPDKKFTSHIMEFVKQFLSQDTVVLWAHGY